jgi:hypothetical protein
MFVIIFMAGVTIHWGFFIAIVRMAAFAWNFDMLIAKLIACLVMVESELLPIPIRMTVGACASQFAFVLIVFLVAAIAIGGRFTILGLGFMAGLALDLLRVGMGALEREVCPLMIEGQFRDRRNILRSAFVICMAFLAFALLLKSPMRSLLLHDVRTNVFVAILAEGILRRLVEPLVTLRAVFFPLRMAFDHLSRHQCRLDVVC